MHANYWCLVSVGCVGSCQVAHAHLRPASCMETWKFYTKDPGSQKGRTWKKLTEFAFFHIPHQHTIVSLHFHWQFLFPRCHTCTASPNHTEAEMDHDESKPPIADIAPDGDVILFVGPEKTPLKVYSQCLRAASKVFRVMFGPDWSEGKGLTSRSPREIPLEEDDASALRTILCVLHHRNAEVPDSQGFHPRTSSTSLWQPTSTTSPSPSSLQPLSG